MLMLMGKTNAGLLREAPPPRWPPPAPSARTPPGWAMSSCSTSCGVTNAGLSSGTEPPLCPAALLHSGTQTGAAVRAQRNAARRRRPAGGASSGSWTVCSLTPGAEAAPAQVVSPLQRHAREHPTEARRPASAPMLTRVSSFLRMFAQQLPSGVRGHA